MADFSVPQFDTNKFNLGSVCKKGHTFAHYKLWNLRSIKTGVCLECDREKANKRRLEHPEYSRNRYLEKKDHILNLNRKWRENNAEYKKVLNKNWNQRNKRRCVIYAQRYQNTPEGQINQHYHRFRRRARKRSSRVESKINLQSILDYFNNECCYCGSKESLTFDHIKAVSKGGSHTLHNLAIACQSCNYSKGAKDLLEWFRTRKFYTVERFVKVCRWQYPEN